MMAGIRGKDTKPEMLIRRALHQKGFRYRLHDRKLPGRPDMVFPRFKAVIFIHGCFWHMHGCHLFKWPSTRKAFWRQKLEGNRKRDALSYRNLQESGWRILTIWECALKSRSRLSEEEVMLSVTNWLTTGNAGMEIEGK